MKGAIRVFCRVRPLINREIELGDEEVVFKTGEMAMAVERTKKAGGSEMKNFAFDSIFEAGTAQEKVYEECQGLIQSAVDGFNVTIFAYGQTGAGKTFTMYGSEEQPGLAPRAIQSLFNVIRRDEKT